MDRINLKIGREIYKIDKNDIVMDNGVIIQVITKEVGSVWYRKPLKMSKKLFNELKKVGFLYIDDDVEELAEKRYQGSVLLYRFNITEMRKLDTYKSE